MRIGRPFGASCRGGRDCSAIARNCQHGTLRAWPSTSRPSSSAGAASPRRWATPSPSSPAIAKRPATPTRTTSSARTPTSTSSPASTSPTPCAVFNPSHAKERFVLFVRPRDREMEIWTGRRAGVEGAIATYGADAAYTIDELDARLREYAIDRPGLVYRLGNPQHDGRVTRLLSEMRGVRVRGGFVTAARVEDPEPILHEMRLRRRPKSLPGSAAPARSAATPTSRPCASPGPASTSTRCRPRIEFVFRRGGSPRNALSVASWPPAPMPASSTTTRTGGGWRTATSCSSTPAASGAITPPTSRARFR